LEEHYSVFSDCAMAALVIEARYRGHRSVPPEATLDVLEFGAPENASTGSGAHEISLHPGNDGLNKWPRTPTPQTVRSPTLMPA